MISKYNGCPFLVYKNIVCAPKCLDENTLEYI